MTAQEVLVRGARELDIELTSDQTQLFLSYLEILKFWNKRINLTATEDEREIIINHFLDSISILPFISKNARVLDIGSGAGFPGIPLKIVEPSLEVTLLDSVQKKVFFMRDAIRKLKLSGIRSIYGRAEDYNNGIPREYFDFVASRAVGKIESLLDLGTPYLREQGEIILMRGRRGLEEWNRIGKTNQSLRLINCRKFSLPFSKQERVILVIAIDT
ncbi:MAG TPA: 16S rRNA (guanine(527)-N(7))-methyltransferase RsmG [Thermodesulfobacteriota bacterium]|nr:16S rRNA (guanine(527)-N(7))-methyltransferase RsmG [Thermodesulfobacteriota bacterium]